MKQLHAIAISMSAALMVGACAPKASYRSFAPRMTTDAITLAEMESSGVSDPYEAVTLLRPNWLRPKVRLGTRGDRNGIPTVYAQSMRLGTIHELASLRVEGIQEIRYVNPIDATTRWGMGHTSGVIELIWVDQPQR